MNTRYILPTELGMEVVINLRHQAMVSTPISMANPHCHHFYSLPPRLLLSPINYSPFHAALLRPTRARIAAVPLSTPQIPQEKIAAFVVSSGTNEASTRLTRNLPYENIKSTLPGFIHARGSTLRSSFLSLTGCPILVGSCTRQWATPTSGSYQHLLYRHTRMWHTYCWPCGKGPGNGS